MLSTFKNTSFFSVCVLSKLNFVIVFLPLTIWVFRILHFLKHFGLVILYFLLFSFFFYMFFLIFMFMLHSQVLVPWMFEDSLSTIKGNNAQQYTIIQTQNFCQHSWTTVSTTLRRFIVLWPLGKVPKLREKGHEVQQFFSSSSTFYYLLPVIRHAKNRVGR